MAAAGKILFVGISLLDTLTMPLDWGCGELHEGACCYHSGAYFEAHEHWEAVWLKATEPEKTFLQGLIQLTAAFHHFQRGNRAGTKSLLQSALRRLEKYPEVFGGIELAALRGAVGAWLEALVAQPPAALPQVPKLKFAPDPAGGGFVDSTERAR